jgi:hypothetical protein
MTKVATATFLRLNGEDGHITGPTSSDSVPLVHGNDDIPTGRQRALLLRQPKQRLELVQDWVRPTIEADDEVLVQIHAIGLNPM